VGEECPLLTDGQKMFRFFYEELEAAYERGEPDLILLISRVYGQVGVYLMPVMSGVRRHLSEDPANIVRESMENW
jgi:hypothetical protein